MIASGMVLVTGFGVGLFAFLTFGFLGAVIGTLFGIWLGGRAVEDTGFFE